MQTLVTVKQMAFLLCRCERTFRKYVRQYKIPHIRLGRDMLFNPQDVENYLKNLTFINQPPDPAGDNLTKEKVRIKRNVNHLNNSRNKYAQLLGLG